MVSVEVTELIEAAKELLKDYENTWPYSSYYRLKSAVEAVEGGPPWPSSDALSALAG